MPQQINLYPPVLLTSKRYLSAQSWIQALALFLVAGAGYCAYVVSGLNTASESLKNSLASQTHELESLQQNLTEGRAGVAPLDVNLTKDIQSLRSELAQREKFLQEVRLGLFKPGWGYSAQLQLLAETIPASVWLTVIQADGRQFEVSGFTLAPDACGEWVTKLGASKLLDGPHLASLKVDLASSVPATRAKPGVAVRAPLRSSEAAANAAPPTWSFRLVSAVAKASDNAQGKS